MQHFYILRVTSKQNTKTNKRNAKKTPDVLALETVLHPRLHGWTGVTGHGLQWRIQGGGGGGGGGFGGLKLPPPALGNLKMAAYQALSGMK